MQDLKEVVDWKQFGLLIDVADYELENIDESVRGPKKCRYEMLRHWMQTEVNKKWLTVVNALAQMCHGVLATTIALKYGTILCPSWSQHPFCIMSFFCITELCIIGFAIFIETCIYQNDYTLYMFVCLILCRSTTTREERSEIPKRDSRRGQ